MSGESAGHGHCCGDVCTSTMTGILMLWYKLVQSEGQDAMRSEHDEHGPFAEYTGSFATCDTECEMR